MADGLPTYASDWPQQQQFNRMAALQQDADTAAIAALQAALAAAQADIDSLTTDVSTLSDAIDACCS